MTISLPAAADGLALRRMQAVAPAIAESAWRLVLRHWGAFAALAFTFAVHAPTLLYFFDGDDFVVLGSVEYLGTREYLLDSWRMHDIVPNWRPLTAVVYAAEWRFFGLNPMGWRVVNLAVHLSSVAVLYALVLRTARRPAEDSPGRAIGAVAALIFGVSGAHFDTVTYVTALPHVLATFFVLSSLLAMVIYAGQGPGVRGEGSGRPALYWLSFALFALAFLSNEGAFVYAPVIVAAYALFAWRSGRPPDSRGRLSHTACASLRLVLHAAPFAALAAGWLAFYQSCSCGQLKFDEYYWGAHVFRNYGVYLSWLVYPARSIPLSPDALRWTLAGVAVGVGGITAARGPHLARVAALGVVLALLPFAPVHIWTASRYSYGAVAFFAPLAAIAGYAIYERVRESHRFARAPATALALLFVAVVGGLYAWQTTAQDARSGRYGERWQLLTDELRANYADVPDGATIYIIDGLWQNPMEQYAWMPSVARALYGDAAAFDFARVTYEENPPDARNALFLEWRDGHLYPVSLDEVRRR
jgi:hypothetical protein